MTMNNPQSVIGATLNEHFFKSHILQSSPYFKEEYVTLNGQCVIYKNGAISTKTGFASPRKVYVLGEELFYTENFKSFTVYSISAPLVGVHPLHSIHSPSSPSIVTPPSSSSMNGHHRRSGVHSKSKSKYHHQHGPYSGTVPAHHRLKRASSSSSTVHSRPHSHHRQIGGGIGGHRPSSSMMNVNGLNGHHLESGSVSVQIGLIPIEERTDRHWQSLLSVSLSPVIYKKMMEDTVSFCDQFNRSYVMIKGYTKAAAQRIEEFRSNIFEDLIAGQSTNKSMTSKKSRNSKSKHHSSAHYANNRQQQPLSGHKVDELKSAFDSYLNSILYDRVYGAFLVRQYKSEDVVFRKQLNLLRTLSQSAIGIKPQFQNLSNFKSAVRHLAAINSVKTPKQKLGVLQETMHRIRGCIDSQNGATTTTHCGSRKEEDMALTTNDMLSMFTFVLIHSEMERVESENEYIQHFYFPLDCTAHLTYYAATLQAAIQYCREQLFQKKEVKLQRRKSAHKPPKVVNRFGRSRSEHHRVTSSSTNPFDI